MACLVVRSIRSEAPEAGEETPEAPGCWDFRDWNVDQNGWQGYQEGWCLPDPYYPSFPIIVRSNL